MRFDHPTAQVTEAETPGSTVTRQHLLTGDLTGRRARIDRAELHQVTQPLWPAALASRSGQPPWPAALTSRPDQPP